MQELFKTLLLVSAICALSAFLLPEKNKKLRRSAEFAIALFVLAALANPLATLSELSISLDELQYPTLNLPTDHYTDAAWAEMEKAVGDGIARDLSLKYGVAEEDIAAAPTLELADNELTVKRLTLSLSHSAAALDLIAVRAYAEATYSTVCEVKTNAR